MIAALIADALTTFDAPTQARLGQCIPYVTQALDQWCDAPYVECPPLLLCAATTKSAILLRADGWLELDEKKRAKLKPEDVAAALMAAVESPMSAAVTERILVAACTLLGPGGVAQQIASAERIARVNALPIHVLLLQQEGVDITAAILTLGVPLPQGVTLH